MDFCTKDTFIKDIFTQDIFTQDILCELFLHCDIDTMVFLSQVNKLAYQITINKSCWVEKYNRYNFYLPILEKEQNYIRIFNTMHDQIKNCNIILKINDIEYNRSYNKTKGVIDVLIDYMSPDNLNGLFDQVFLTDTFGYIHYNFIRFIIDNDEYSVILIKDHKTQLYIGNKTRKEVEKIFYYALLINNYVCDYNGYSFLSMTDNSFDEEYLIHNNDDDIIPIIRRGLWEGMLNNNTK